MTRDPLAPFLIEDFEGTPGNWTPLKHSDSLIAMELANAKFRELLEACPKIRQWKTQDYQSSWFYDDHECVFHPPTHEAYLWGIREIEK